MDIEDDDEFGDLYTDLLRPIPSAAAARPTAAAAPSGALIGIDAGTGDDVDGDEDDDILYGPSKMDLEAPPAQTLAPLAADDVDDWMLGGPPDNVEEPASWDDEVEEIPSKSEQIPGLNLSSSIKSNTFKKSSVLLEHNENLEIGNEEPVIPGLGAAPVMTCSETGRSRSDDSDSDSEDDLQIVLNDAHHGPVAAAQMNMNLQNDEDDNDDEDDDDDGDDFVIVANKDQQHHHHAVMEGQEWVEEATQPGGDGETKDAAEAGKGGVVAAGVVGPRLGYGSHGFHPQHYSMYKYVRPGAAPVGGATAAASGGASAQIRPQLTMPPLAGRGRGDWRPAMGRGVSTVQKSFHPGSSLAPLGGVSNRVFGIGLDFTLPSHKSVFDVDIDSFEEKPWRLPGVDISDFFNFGLDEDKWKEYRKQLEQLRLESTMQSKIRVYESGRSEQEHDPDLPPELAAAAGLNDTTSENLRGRSDVGQADLTGQGRGVSRPSLPTGRAIQVESGYGERLPSIDTRAPRIRDSDAIIEIVCQDFVDDTAAAVEQTGSELDREHIKGVDEAPGHDEPAQSENHDSLSQNISSRGREPSNRRGGHFTPERDDSISSPEAAVQSHSYSKSRGRAYPHYHEGRLASRSSRGRYSNGSAGHSIDVVASQNEHAKPHDRDCTEISEESMDANDASATVSPAVGVESTKDVSPEQVDIDDRDEKLALGDSVELDGEDVASDSRVSFGTAGNDSLAQSSKKQKLSSRVEQPIIEDHNEGEELKVTQSDSGRGKLRKEKDNRKQQESGEVSDGKSRRGSDLRRHHEEDEHRSRRKDDYGREGRQEIERSRAASRGYADAYHSHAQRDLDTMMHPTRGRIELHERSKERDSSVSVWHTKDSEVHSRRFKEEEIRRDQGEDFGWKHRSKNRSNELKDRNEDMHFRKRIDDGDYRLRDREGASRQRERRDDLLPVRRDEISDPLLLRRRGEDEHIRRDRIKKEDMLHGHKLRDDSTRRKKERERDDGPDRRRREDTIRGRDKPEDHHSSRHKDDNWYQKEREERQRLKQPQEDVQKHGDREGRGASRNGVVDHKTSGNRKTRDESKKLGLTDYHHKDKRRNENSRGDQNGEEISYQRAREDGSNNDNKVSEEDRISRRERSTSHNDYLSNTSNNNNMNQDRLRASTRQKSENEASQVNFQSQNKRKREDNSAQHSELVNKKVRSEPQRGENGLSLNDERTGTLQQAQNSILGQGEIASDDEYSDSRRGRSKLERWTSHKERDFSAVDNRRSFSSSSRVKVISDTTTDIEKEQPGEQGKNEAQSTGELEAKDSDVGHVPEKKEDLDKHLDTVAKLKRRSERFNLPMPGEKDVTGNKKNHNELPTQAETTADAEIKPERPARKRKWTSG